VRKRMGSPVIRKIKKGAAKSRQWTAPIGEDCALFTQTLEHARLAFGNAQDVIRFIDAKCNVLVALTTVISGFAISLAKWNFELPSKSPLTITAIAQAHHIRVYLIVLPLIVSLVATAVCIAGAVWSLIARPPKSGGFTVLFPLPRNLTDEKHREILIERLSGMEEEVILNEFSEQLATLGRISQTKLRSSRIVAWAVLVQVGALIISLLAYGAVALPKP